MNVTIFNSNVHSLDDHRATHTYMRLDGYRARQSLVGLSAHCANSYIPQHICIV